MISNRHGEAAWGAAESMLRITSGSALRLVALVVPLGLGACADTITADQAASSATLQRSYDKTLSRSEQKAVISDLQKAAGEKEQAD